MSVARSVESPGRARIDIHDLWISEAVMLHLLRPWSRAVRASHYSSFQS